MKYVTHVTLSFWQKLAVITNCCYSNISNITFDKTDLIFALVQRMSECYRHTHTNVSGLRNVYSFYTEQSTVYLVHQWNVFIHVLLLFFPWIIGCVWMIILHYIARP